MTLLLIKTNVQKKHILIIVLKSEEKDNLIFYLLTKVFSFSFHLGY